MMIKTADVQNRVKKLRLFLFHFTRSLFVKLGVFVAFTLCIIFLAKSDLFLIAVIQCKTQYGPCAVKDNDALREFKGKNLFFANNSLIRKKLGQDFNNRRVLVQKVFPGMLAVVLEKRKAIVALKLDVSPKGVYLVDVDGVVIGFLDASSLPVLTLKKNVDHLIVGKEVELQTKNAINIYSDIGKLTKVEAGFLDVDKLTVVLADNITAYLPVDKDPQVVVGALQLILVRSRIDSKIPSSIDLRYDNPVLKY